MKKLNLNEIVFVRLNEYGKQVYRNHENELNQFIKVRFPKIKLTHRNLNEEIGFQLWELIKIFGKYLDIGKKTTFINNEINISEDLLEGDLFDDVDGEAKDIFMEIKKCSDCKFSRGCPIYLKIRQSNRKSNLIIYIPNEKLEAYNDLYANICNLYNK